jgi:protein-tyrosine phosphatase
MGEYRIPSDHRFEQVFNFRDLGGHTTADGRRVAKGRLLRSGHLGHASEADVAILARYGLRRVFDFRTASDIEQEGADRLPPGAENVRLPMPDPARGGDIRRLMTENPPEKLPEIFGGGRAEAMMRESAAGLVRERREPYSQFLKELAREGSVVLLAIGVPEEQVVEQYLLSNRAAQEIIERNRLPGREQWTGILAPLIGVREEYIHSSFEAVRQEWGDFDGYLREGLRVSDAERESLRKNLLE